MQKAQPEIFFSYAWGGEKEEVALNLYQHLLQEGFKVTIDRYDVGYKGSIVQFMKRMGRSSCIIVVLSDKYLKSPYCMFELLEIYRKSNSDIEEMLAKIYPVVMNDADILTTEGILNYVRYWEQKATSLKNEMKDIELEFVADLVEDFKTRHEIALNIGLLTKLIKNIKTLNPQSLQENNYETIKKAILEKGAIQPPNGLPQHLLTPPFQPDLFLGREKELEHIRQQLFGGENMLLLVNGTGGVGKTSLAARYYHNYANEYMHLAWVLSEKSIANALLLLGLPLGLRFEDQMPQDQRLALLLQTMANLPRPCLLVIDNANELDDLEAHYTALRRCPNFHLLLTTRITAFAKAAICPVGALPYPLALQLFTEHYPSHNPADDALFEQVYNAVEGNTLIIELLAKNLQVMQDTHTDYGLAQLVADLQKGILQLTQTKAVESTYHADTLFKANPLHIIAAMYDISELAPAEKRLLSILAVLPAESMSFTTLQGLLPDTEGLGDTLHSLSRKGWIAHDQQAAAYKISPVIQEITRIKNTDLLEDCGELIVALTDKLDYEPGVGHFIKASYQEAVLFARYGESLLDHFIIDKTIFDLLLKRLGRCHEIIGNLPKALYFFEKNRQLCELLLKVEPSNPEWATDLSVVYQYLGNIQTNLGNLSEAFRYYENYQKLIEHLSIAYPDNVNFKNGLAISYEKLGQTYASMGNLPEALRFYQLDADLTQQLYDAYPDNVNFKNGLAISFSKLGQTYADMGNLPEALRFYQLRSTLGQQLYDAYPDNVNFKNGLAISYEKLGQTYANMGDLTKALQFYEDQTVLFKQLFADYPDNVAFKNGLAVSYEKLGETYAAMGNLPKALQFYEDETVLFKQLFADYPDNVGFKNGLAIAYSKLGQTYADMGNLTKALQFYEDETVLFKQLFADYPDNVGFKNGLAVSYIRLALIYEAQEEPAKARELNEKAKAIWQQLVNDSPEYTEFKNNLEWVNSKLA